MLDVIADFWKPAKKTQPQEKLEPSALQVGSTIGFGFVPQAALSGRRLNVSAINTYQFGSESLTSFVLSEGAITVASMIVAEAEDEHYLAISRHIATGDRAKLFDLNDIEAATSKSDFTKLACKDGSAEYKGWVVASYRREIQSMKGHIFKGDYRKRPLPSAPEGQEFEYTLLVSESNEHAIEIEKYEGGRMEIYATVYRRMNDVGEITHPLTEARPEIKLASEPQKPVAPAAPVVAQPQQPPKPAAPAMSSAANKPAGPSMGAQPPKLDTPPRPAPIKLQEFSQTPVAATAKLPAKPIETPKKVAETPARPMPIANPNTLKETAMTPATETNGAQKPAAQPETSKLYVQPTAPESYMKQEVKAVTNRALNDFQADAIECDLRVANKIIDEAIRNEMRLTDIVRRIIELPVAYPESVQIPVTLTDEDYALLAIRYGIPASDRNAIKRRIIEDLNDFSGAAKKLAA